MASKKFDSKSVVTKITDSKFSSEVENILDATMGSLGPVTRNKAIFLGQ